jgi:hypothetical protein
MRRLPRRAAVERAVGTLWPPSERDEMRERLIADMIHGDPIIVSTWGPDLSRLWDGVALWVALEMVDGVAHGAHGPAVSYWPR